MIGCAFSESSLEVAEKGLGHSVVPTAAFSTHALHELLFCDDLPEIIAGLLHSLVTVNHQPGGRLACADGLPKGGENPFGLKGIAQVSVLPLKVGRGRVGIPGNFRVLKVRIAEVAE